MKIGKREGSLNANKIVNWSKMSANSDFNFEIGEWI